MPVKLQKQGKLFCGDQKTVQAIQNFLNTFYFVLLQLYMYQMFRSLAYIHSVGICHRDIKPQNLLLDPETAVLKLCDFGR